MPPSLVTCARPRHDRPPSVVGGTAPLTARGAQSGGVDKDKGVNTSLGSGAGLNRSMTPEAGPSDGESLEEWFSPPPLAQSARPGLEEV